MIGNRLVEEADQRPHQPALGLALLAEKQHVVPGEQGEVDLGDDGVFVADDAGKQLLAGCSMRRKLSRISCLTVLETQPLAQVAEIGRSIAGGH